MSCRRSIQIFALGSPHGDDRVAWVAADRLSQDSAIRPFVHTLVTPWDMVQLLLPDCSVIVIDACLGCSVPGAVHRLTGRELATSPAARHSTHGGSLAGSIELAATLQRTIRELVVFAVEVESCEPGTELSESAHAGVDAVVEQIRAQLSEWMPAR
ncbi:MAG: hydrogenase maturation protease [Planctomycetaceae bacterium]|nr:hydrogenase maturation protease [Planctomycetales bacterium]MCB9927115.1 hydrogenase maturation protease [Planctomycetaceae bacterium]